MSDDMDAYREVFLQESAEYVQGIIDGMLALENDPNDLEPVEVVFRGAHSLKGMSAAMGYERAADLTHKMESLMDTVRKRAQEVDRSLIDLMLEAVDAAKAVIESETSGGEPPDTTELAARIAARTEGAGVVEAVGAGVRNVQPGQDVMLHPGVSCGVCEKYVERQAHKPRVQRIASARAGGMLRRDLDRLAAPGRDGRLRPIRPITRSPIPAVSHQQVEHLGTADVDLVQDGERGLNDAARCGEADGRAAGC